MFASPIMGIPNILNLYCNKITRSVATCSATNFDPKVDVSQVNCNFEYKFSEQSCNRVGYMFVIVLPLYHPSDCFQQSSLFEPRFHNVLVHLKV